MQPSAPFTGKAELPLIPGFLRGYRSWMVPIRSFEGTWLLRSTSIVRHFWMPGRNTATCNFLYEQGRRAVNARPGGQTSGTCICGCGVQDAVVPEHPTPSTTTSCKDCGFYGMHAAHMYDYVARSHVSTERDPKLVVYGTFKATGRVCIGEWGFRSQYAEIEALAGPSAHHFAETYGVPCIEGGLEELQALYPPTRVEGVDYTPRPLERNDPPPYMRLYSSSPTVTGGFSTLWKSSDS